MKSTSIIVVLTLTVQVCAFGQLTGRYQYLKSTTDKWNDLVDSAFVEFTEDHIFKYWEHSYLGNERTSIPDIGLGIAKWWIIGDSLYVFTKELDAAEFDSIFWETAKALGFYGDREISMSKWHFQSKYKFEVRADNTLTLYSEDKLNSKDRIEELRKIKKN